MEAESDISPIINRINLMSISIYILICCICRWQHPIEKTNNNNTNSLYSRINDIKPFPLVIDTNDNNNIDSKKGDKHLFYSFSV